MGRSNFSRRALEPLWLGSMRLAVAFLFAASASLANCQTLEILRANKSSIGALTLGRDGVLYGTVAGGEFSDLSGVGLGGAVVRVGTDGSVTALATFDCINSTFPNGRCPSGSLTIGNDGALYGMTSGLADVPETVFKVTTNGVLMTLATLPHSYGSFASPLTLGNDGNFYGTREISEQNYGSFFRLTPTGTLTTLMFFTQDNGSGYWPAATVTVGPDGNFYGTTERGGTMFSGTVFRMTPNGTSTTLASFLYPYGTVPLAALTLGRDGDFYGTASDYDTGYGTVFRVTASGSLSLVAAFNGTNGICPRAALTLGPDGNFYGTASRGGIGWTPPSPSLGNGTVFVVSPGGNLVRLGGFTGGDGRSPRTPLTLANDGNFYGTTAEGGSYAQGTLFRLRFKPIILAQPQSQTNAFGGTVAFRVTSASSQPCNFQWTKDGAVLTDGGSVSGATSNELLIASISDRDAGSYSVTISNANGSVTSSNGVLTVLGRPTLTVQMSAGHPLLTLNGGTGQSVTIQYSTNLAEANWGNLLSITNVPASPYQFVDPANGTQPARFYRSVAH